MNDAQVPSERADIAKALRRAFLLGQTYWKQSDSENYRENKKANATFDKFRALADETVAALSAPASGASEPAEAVRRPLTTDELIMLAEQYCGECSYDAPDHSDTYTFDRREITALVRATEAGITGSQS